MTLRRSWSSVTIMVALLVGALSGDGGLAGSKQRFYAQAPEFPSLDQASWIGAPVSLASQRGNVVLLNVWTLACVNCQRTLPWLVSTAARYKGDGLTVIGIHSPEFDSERGREAVDQARARHGLFYSSFLDNDLRYWRTLRNRYWPTVYLIDREGKIRRIQAGEIHARDPVALSIEQEIEALLAERSR